MIRRRNSTMLTCIKCLALIGACALLRPTSATANPNAPVIWYDGQISHGVWCIQRVFSLCADHPMDADSTYGPITRKAVLDIQHLFKLAEDGEVGPITGEMIRYVGNNCMIPEFGRRPLWDAILAPEGCNDDVPTQY
jgi:hypothetical protein